MNGKTGLDKRRPFRVFTMTSHAVVNMFTYFPVAQNQKRIAMKIFPVVFIRVYLAYRPVCLHLSEETARFITSHKTVAITIRVTNIWWADGRKVN